MFKSVEYPNSLPQLNTHYYLVKCTHPSPRSCTRSGVSPVGIPQDGRQSLIARVRPSYVRPHAASDLQSSTACPPALSSLPMPSVGPLASSAQCATATGDWAPRLWQRAAVDWTGFVEQGRWAAAWMATLLHSNKIDTFLLTIYSIPYLLGIYWG